MLLLALFSFSQEYICMCRLLTLADTWNDLVRGKKGEYRIRFKDNIHGWDCCCPGVELLPDGTFVVTTYGHREKDKQPYILSVIFTLKETDEKKKRME